MMIIKPTLTDYLILYLSSFATLTYIFISLMLFAVGVTNAAILYGLGSIMFLLITVVNLR